MDLTLVDPGAPGPSGGSIYNERLAAALVDAGHRMRMIPVGGDWPNAAAHHHRVLAAALREGPAGSVVLVDGLMASAAPDAVRAAVDAGTTVWVLLHLPLPAEAGLSEADKAAFAASEEMALRHASGVICTSNWAREDLQHRYLLDRVYAAPPGTEPAEIAMGDSSGGNTGSNAGSPAGNNTPHLLMVGSLTPRKNHSVLLAALADIVDLPWTASLVGGPLDSPHATRLMELAGQLPPGRVAFPGVLRGSALDAEWARTDLLLLPSVAETFGMVVTEALARGIPGVVGRGTGAVEALTGGTPENAGGDLAGAVVDPSNPEHLSELLRAWLTDAPLRKSWRTAALRRRGTLPTWATTATTLLKIIDP
ncbi:glycosyltransferase family 4 protein [Arthrobacter sp. CAN_C5]|uniref:glycosyltransferase family 4 protein n=1 Tax=Arthrobacter sp. CAN_C5 TaxID=2760706 RepID=UPI001AE2443F|nr:glycosyltransferase family 4 protein [Arthrobacter sp. CAN_C5]MBP2216281.1 glycosyltransferase involved in cell wall biosynthesis [Arthrobacter sp. CAN_C5]